MIRSRFRASALGALFLTVAAGHADEPAAAPEAAPISTAQLGAVVVTADKRQGYVNRVPSSISAYGGEDLKAAGVDDARDLGKLVAGFTYADSGFDTPVYTLRGVGFADSSFAHTSTVGVYADEVSLAYPVMTKGMNLDLRRVEIEKGPQGTLYGRNATGGTINTIANLPTRQFETGADIGYGRFGRIDSEAFVSGPIGDSLRARLAVGETYSSEGWQKSQTRDDRLGKLDKQAARATLDWRPGEDVLLRLTLAGWLDHSEPQAPYAVALQPQNPFFGQAGLDPSVRNYPVNAGNHDPQAADWNPNRDFRLHDNFWMASLRPSWNISDSLRLIGLFSVQQVRADGSALPQGGLNVEDIDQILHGQIRTGSGELRLEGNVGEHADWLLGVAGNYDRQHEVIEGHGSENSLNIGVFGDTPPADTPIFFEKGAAKGDGDVHGGSVFADGSWEFVPTLKLALGARYTKELQRYAGCTYVDADNKSLFPFPYFTLAGLLKQNYQLPPIGSPADLVNFLTGLNPNVPQGACGSLDAEGKAGLFTGRLSEHNLSYRSVLSWTPDKRQLYYASYTRGYKAGGFPTIFSVDQASLAPVVQERLDAYEIGAKIGGFDKRVQANAALFYYDYRNKQLLTYFKDPIFGALQYLQNVPKSFDEGAELSLSVLPLDRLVVTAVGSYIRTKVVRYQGLTSTGAAFDFAGQPFNYTPRLQSTLMANYSIPLAYGINAAPGFSFTYAGGTNATLEHDPLYALPAHRIWDLHLSFAPDNRRWILSVYGRNVGNEFYRSSVIKLGDSVFAYTGQPASYGVSLSANWR